MPRLAERGVLLGSGSARAAAAQDYGSVTVTSDDGTVNYVALYGASKVEWDGFDSVAESFSVEVTADLLDSDKNHLRGPYQFHPEKTFDLNEDSWGGNGETHTGPGTSGTIESDIGYGSSGNKAESVMWEVVAEDTDDDNLGEAADPQGLNEYALPQEAIPASALTTNTDGGSTWYNIRLYNTYTWYDSGDNAIFSKEFTSDVAVEVVNEPAEVTGSSGGESGVVGN